MRKNVMSREAIVRIIIISFISHKIRSAVDVSETTMWSLKRWMMMVMEDDDGDDDDGTRTEW